MLKISINQLINFIVMIFIVVLHGCGGSGGNDGGAIGVPPLSSLKISSLVFLDAGGREGHGGLIEVQGSPAAGKGQLEIRTPQDLTSLEVEFVSPTSSVISTYTVPATPYYSDENFTWNLFPEIPSSAFTVRVKGLNKQKQKYTFTTDAYVPQTFSARLSSSLPLLPVGNQRLELTINNHGGSRVFDTSIVNNLGYTMLINPIYSRITVLENESSIIPFEIVIPQSADTGKIQFAIVINVANSITGTENITITPELTVVSAGPPLYVKDPHVEFMIGQCDKMLLSSETDFWVGVAGDADFDASSIITESVKINTNIKPAESIITNQIGFHMDVCPSVLDSIPDYVFRFNARDIYTLKTVSGQQLVPVTIHFSAVHSSGDIVDYIAFEAITLN